MPIPVPWKCRFCTLENPGHRRRCDACDQRKGLRTAEETAAEEEDESSHDRPTTGRPLRVYVRVGNRRQSKGCMAFLPPSTADPTFASGTQERSPWNHPSTMDLCLSPSDAITSPPKPKPKPMEETHPSPSHGLPITHQTKRQRRRRPKDHLLSPPGSQESMGMFRYTPPSQEANHSNQPIRSATPKSHPNDLPLGSFHYTPPSQEEMPPSRMKHPSSLDHSLSPLAARVLTTAMTTKTETTTTTTLTTLQENLFLVDRAETTMGSPQRKNSNGWLAAASFATAGTQSRIHVDAAQLQQAADLLQAQSKEAPLVVESSHPTGGFQTAGSTAKMPLENVHLPKAHRRRLEGADAINSSNVPNTTNATATATTATAVVVGFQNAGSKSAIYINEAQLRQAERLLHKEDISFKSKPYRNINSSATLLPDHAATSKVSSQVDAGDTFMRACFHTAGSKSTIQVDDLQLQKASTIFETTRIGYTNSESTLVDQTKRSKSDIGFERNSARKPLVGSTYGIPTPETLHPPISLEPVCGGFSTAGSKSRIQLSEAGLKRARFIFEAPDTPPTKTSPINKHDAASVRVLTVCKHSHNRVSASNLVDQLVVVGDGNEEHRLRPTRSFARDAVMPSSLICPATTLKRKNDSQRHQPCTKRRVSFEPSPSPEDPSCLASSSLQPSGSNVNTDVSDYWFRKTHNKFDNDMLDTSAFGDQSVPFQTPGSKAYINVVNDSRRQVDEPHHECDQNNGVVAIQDIAESTPFGVSIHIDYPKTRASVEESGLREACDPSNLTPEARSNLENIGLTKEPDFRGPESKENSGLSSNTLPSRLSVSFQTAGSNSEIKIDEQSLLRARVILQSDDDTCTGRTVRDSNDTRSAITPATKKPLLSKETTSQSPGWKPSESLHVTAGCRFFPPDVESSLSGVKYPKDDQGTRMSPSLGRPIVTPRVSLGTPCDEFANEHASPDCSYDCELNLNYRFDQNLSLMQSARESVHDNDSSTDSKPSAISIPAVTPVRDFHGDPRAMTCETLSSSRRACVIGSSGDMYLPVNATAVAGSDLSQPLIIQSNDVQNLVHTVEKRDCVHEAPVCRNLVDALRFGALCSCPEVWRSNGVSDITRDITAQNAQKVLFDAKSRLPATFQISHTQDLLGSMDSLKRSLVERGCARECLDDAWVENHKRWIVWKLAAFERSFCAFLGGKYLTFDRLLCGLERRYQVEIVDGRRPALRIILNRDAAASLPMILCVSEVVQLDHDEQKSSGLSTRLRLSDGWYEVDATLDKPLSSLVEKGAVRVGTKLLVTNATMRGADQGVDPLEPEYPSMKPFLVLTANSTKLAKWNSKLGFLRVSAGSDGRKFCPVKRVSDIVLGGGGVECLRILVLRRFPLMYLEKGSIGNATLSEAEEDERRSELERRRTRAIEKLSDAVTKEVENEIDEGAPEVWTKYVVGQDVEVEALGEDDRTVLAAWMVKRRTLLQQRVQEEVEAELETDTTLLRKSTPFVRVLVHSAVTIDLKKPPLEIAVLTVWDPSEEQINVLTEGGVIEAQGLSVQACTYDGFMQLSASGQSPIRRIDPVSLASVKEASGFEPRNTLSMFHVHAYAHRNSQNARWKTFDTVGVTVSPLIPSGGGMPRHALYLTDQSWFLLRVHFEKSPYALSNLRGRDRVLSLNDLQMLPFDALNNCAVARYTSLSSVTRVPSERLVQLERWKNESPDEIERVSAYLKACIPLYESSSAGVLIGTIVGLNPASDGVMLSIEVDCGDSVREMLLPTGSLGTIRDEVEKSPSAILPSEERCVRGMKTLDFLFRAHSIMWRFDVTKRPVGNMHSLVVQKVEKADLQTLACLHSLWS